MKIRWFLLFICVRALQNDFDRHFECPTDQSISHVESIHNNQFEDRVWKFSCRNKGKLGKCQWFYNQNTFDGILLFQCPENEAIVATRSYHDNHHEDRRFSFKCCERKGTKLGMMQLLGTAKESSNVESMNSIAPHGTIQTGIGDGDMFQKNSSRCYFSDFINGFDHRMDYHVPRNRFLHGVFSYHQNNEEDRRWKFEVCDL